ncbi:hypothetical protein [Amycolatopsis saalfeldensis]|uniref:hypothetical protein n=1 Tax=Amycolatopsis saalfeldensis TaxID=394193 RepID=UPI0011603DD7|nr:hypothetical protein [Amycolatopsis saalfeldensis]
MQKLIEAARRQPGNPSATAIRCCSAQVCLHWDAEGRNVLPAVDVIGQNGADVVLQALSQLRTEATAEVTASIAHGRRASSG